METKSGELKRTLGFFGVFALGLSLMVPTTVFLTFGTASINTNGHVPSVFILATMGILFTVFSYCHMIKKFPRAGSAYTYVQQIFNPNLGFLVGWAALFDYLFFPVVYVLSITLYAEAFFPGVPAWIWVVGSMLFTTLANLFNVKVAVSFSTLLVLLQLIISAIFVVLLIKFQFNVGSAHIFSLTPFISKNLTIPVIFSGAVVLFYSFIGIDEISMLAEETHKPTKTLPRAMVGVVVFIGVMYTIVSYFMQVVFPNVGIFSNPDVEIAQKIGGLLFVSVFIGIVIISVLVGGISAQMGVTRLLYAMGRDNVLPTKIFGYISPKSGIPVYNILITGVLGLISIFLTYEQAVSIISFGAYVAFTFVNVCVIKHYIIQEKMRSIKAFIMYLIFPLIGISFIVLMWFNLNKMALITGVTWSFIGCIFLTFITKGFKKPAPTLVFDQAHQEQTDLNYNNSIQEENVTVN
ncbi:Putrescine importer PuuP [Bacillus sp. MUM 116]|uniref:APC family permease n=1 Tax=Bacillus sp. MUM 116 TaxID=1678002 RepID=UPI0008F5EA2C|nr:APC family permease [Bacillus sp. MUM 116]OIK09068.1 Putrescine importer PuuP [Bacillus sp. MUM 116]